MGHVSPLERNKILPTEFISAIVHELKTPLNSIIGLSDLLKEKLKAGKSSDECEDYARDISLTPITLKQHPADSGKS
jgi:signal transduction histidine kinase